MILGRFGRGLATLVVMAITGVAVSAITVNAQQAPSSFGLDLLRGAISEDPNRAKRPPTPPPTDQSSAQSGEKGKVTLVGLVTEDGQRVEKGVVWRIFGARGPDGKPRITATHRDPSPVLELNAGEYLVNVAYGRANVTRRITVMPGGNAIEPFMLNVGVLRVSALLGNNQPAPANAVSFDVLSDDRDQFGQRIKVVSGAKPGRLIRLNSGLYHLVSQYGDANATVTADLTVEPGKLTEAQVTHHAARVTFKLVRAAGGEAIADTQWTIINRQGDIVKESAGALPTHLLAPGTYTASARSQGQVFRRTFAIRSGEVTQVEVMVQ